MTVNGSITVHSFWSTNPFEEGGAAAARRGF